VSECVGVKEICYASAYGRADNYLKVSVATAKQEIHKFCGAFIVLGEIVKFGERIPTEKEI